MNDSPLIHASDKSLGNAKLAHLYDVFVNVLFSIRRVMRRALTFWSKGLINILLQCQSIDNRPFMKVDKVHVTFDYDLICMALVYLAPLTPKRRQHNLLQK